MYFDNTKKNEWKVISTPTTRFIAKIKKNIKKFFEKKDDFDF